MPSSSPAAPRLPSPPNGFTIVELLIVVIVIGVMTAMAVPRFPVAAGRADAAARVLRAELQVVQRTAITRQSNVVVSVDEASNRLRIHEDGDNDGVVDSTERVRSRPLEETVAFRAPGAGGGIYGVSVTAVSGTNLKEISGLPSITFRRDGSASSDLELYFSSRADLPDSWRALAVSPSTGRVEAWRRIGGEWRRLRP